MKAGTIERVIGYVLKDEVQHNLFEGQGEHTRAEIKLPIQVVYQDRPLPKLFTRLPATNGHIVLLIDECGGTADIASMVYIVETLLGLEITDEFDVVEDVQKLARERWKERDSAVGLKGMTNPELGHFCPNGVHVSSINKNELNKVLTVSWIHVHRLRCG